MKKTLVALLFTSTAIAQPIGVQLDGRYLQFDQPPVSVAGRLMVPLRGIFEALQAEVLYTASTRSIKATKGATVVELRLGSRQALINGNSVYLDVPADTLGGRTMVPLRFVSESLGADVKWNGMTRTVLLSSGNSANNPPERPPSAGDKPRLVQVVHNANRTLGPGDSFEVVVTGDPGARASFEVLGSIQSQALKEVSPGRYETRFVIPRGLAIQRGVLVAHLEKNGRESMLEATRTLTVGNSDPSGAEQTRVTPSPDSQVYTSRPTISVRFSEPFRNNSSRLYLDQSEVPTRSRARGQQELEYTPDYDLSQGEHHVRAEAISRRGNELFTRWSFRISGSQSQSPNNGRGLTLDNLYDGNRMPVQFDVTGSASPGSSVNLRVTYPKNSLGGVLTGLEDQFTVPGVVDSSGRYQIPLHIGAVPTGSRFTLTVTDPRTGTSIARSLFRQ